MAEKTPVQIDETMQTPTHKAVNECIHTYLKHRLELKNAVTQLHKELTEYLELTEDEVELDDHANTEKKRM